MTSGASNTTARGAARRVIGGKYELQPDAPLGAGGIAMVYKGRDLRARRDVAIKTLRPEYQANPDSRKRFRQEARMMAFVSHPNLVSIYDLHEEEAGSWIVMEYVPGRNLKRIVENRGALPPEEVLVILDQVAQALDHLHGRKLVHLDVKPQNLILTPDGVVKLIDFGLAQPAGPRQETIGGAAFGTVAYLAPEQASGEAVDAATDVYALGCVAYELLTGQPPFIVPAGPDHQRELIRAHLDLLPVAPSIARPDLNLPSWVDDVIGWSLAKPKEERFHDAPTFARQFRSGLVGALSEDAHPTSRLAAANEERTRSFSLPLRRTNAAGPAERPPAAELDRRASIPTSPAAAKGIASRVYQLGGRAARRTRPLHLTLWKIALVFAVGNILLALVLLSRDGPSALVERLLSVAPGTTTEVTVDDLNLRAGPGAGFDVVDVLPEGTEVRVTGLSRSSAEGMWWPVELERDGTARRGWVWAEGLRPNEWTGRLSWVQGIVERGQEVRERLSERAVPEARFVLTASAFAGPWPAPVT
ncbi:MAG: serine/threonine protein kinase [uncultured Thermomicrobiales bacterium]|uniref:Serine/threonine protein kinase n=1 Tax=uncultured Thermomicrobiales bacterium TaxID=1645740 RepID=A0A6J4UNA5_9BACT|nr:MAG: serine/threonine protein kinase [uncultured Thermomicrobiales bacterium]